MGGGRGYTRLMRRLALALSLAAGLMAWPLASAVAMDQTIEANSNPNEFSPPNIAADVGDTVTWQSSGGNPHNVVFDDGSYRGGGDPVTPDPSPAPRQGALQITKARPVRLFLEA